MGLADLQLDDFDYELPKERIAQYPLEVRDQSKLLVYEKGQINHLTFNRLPQILGNKSMFVFNDTKVIPARIFFRKTTGALIEVFLLEPIAPERALESALSTKGSSYWKCMIGNAKKWKDESMELVLDQNQKLTLKAHLENREEQIVRFEWSEAITFSNVIEMIGHIPLPPYLDREDEQEDQFRYQTIYAKK